jgi:hypothetical protein
MCSSYLSYRIEACATEWLCGTRLIQGAPQADREVGGPTAALAAVSTPTATPTTAPRSVPSAAPTATPNPRLRQWPQEAKDTPGRIDAYSGCLSAHTHTHANVEP